MRSAQAGSVVHRPWRVGRRVGRPVTEVRPAGGTSEPTTALRQRSVASSTAATPTQVTGVVRTSSRRSCLGSAFTTARSTATTAMSSVACTGVSRLPPAGTHGRPGMSPRVSPGSLRERRTRRSAGGHVESGASSGRGEHPSPTPTTRPLRATGRTELTPRSPGTGVPGAPQVTRPATPGTSPPTGPKPSPRSCTSRSPNGSDVRLSLSGPALTCSSPTESRWCARRCGCSTTCPSTAGTSTQA